MTTKASDARFGTEGSFTFYQFDADLRICIRTTVLLARFFRKFHAKANETGAFPNETICMTVFFDRLEAAP